MESRGRSDDQPAVMVERLAVCEKENKPLLDYDAARGVRNADASGSADAVFETVRAIVKERSARFEK